MIDGLASYTASFVSVLSFGSFNPPLAFSLHAHMTNIVLEPLMAVQFLLH